MSKTCTACRTTKPIECFSVDSYRKDKRCVRCRACRRLVYLTNRAAVAENSRRYYVANKERHGKLSRAHYQATRAHRSKMMAKWYRANKEIVAANVCAYRAAHPGFDAAKRAKRRAQEIRATPSWADLGAIKAIYAEAARRTLETGIPHHVDHKIPLLGRTICGLHIALNLQILTAIENVAKSNKFDDGWKAIAV